MKSPVPRLYRNRTASKKNSPENFTCINYSLDLSNYSWGYPYCTEKDSLAHQAVTLHPPTSSETVTVTDPYLTRFLNHTIMPVLAVICILERAIRAELYL